MAKQNLDEELQNEYKHWNHLYTHGGQDPFWTDGCNLNLVRNHIIHAKRKMEEAGELTETYYKELPPEVDVNYMARPDEIRANAKKSLEIYKNNDDYQYLCKVINSLTKNQVKDTSIKNVINYTLGLESYIKEGDLVAMRRHERPDRYIESFVSCRKKTEEMIKKEPEGQISIFDILQ